MVPSRIKKKSRNNQFTAQSPSYVMRKTRQIHSPLKTTHRPGPLTKEKVNNKIKSMADNYSVVIERLSKLKVHDAPALRKLTVEANYQGTFKADSKIDEGGDRLPDEKSTESKENEPKASNLTGTRNKNVLQDRTTSSNDKHKDLTEAKTRFMIQIARRPKVKTEKPPKMISTLSKYPSMREVPKLDAPLPEINEPGGSEVNDLGSGSMHSVDSGFERDKTSSIRIDFTPNKFDDKYSQKCLEFWSYLNTRDDLKHLCEYPKEDPKPEGGRLMTDEQKLEMNKSYNKILKQHKEEFNYSGIQTLVKYKYLSQSKPSMDSYSYRPVTKTDEAKSLCAEMDEFDKKHPKSFENPGPMPILVPSTMANEVKKEL